MTWTWDGLVKDIVRRITDRKCLAFAAATWLIWARVISEQTWLVCLIVFTGAKVYETLKTNGKKK